MSGAPDRAALIELARAWMLDDPDPETIAELTELVDQAALRESRDKALADEALAEEALAELASRFAGRLTFGTAGLRAEVGAGVARMNSKVVMQTSAGFAKFLLERRVTSGPAPSVVIGWDARTKSDQFARHAAEVFAGAGCSVTLLDGPLPTPVLAYAVRFLAASAGVMITASHNPPRDNGYKVYLGDADAGSQIAPPVDAQISSCIDDAASLPLMSIARDASVDVDAQATQSVLDAYVAGTVLAIAGSGAEGGDALEKNVYTMYTKNNSTPPTPPTIVYTAMHGVGFDLTSRVFAAASLPELHSVAEQQQPDGSFPTVSFPNPEEPGALDLAFARAERERAHLIIAHDPDADRLAIALPARDGRGFTQLTGNQLGLLLGWECAERASARPDAHGQQGSLAATVVSSPALQTVAAEYGLDFVQTLSGFKWVSRVPNLVFGFEEALGYLVNPGVIRDKDGISAALLVATMVSNLHAQGKTLWDRLDEASMRFGHSASEQITLRMSDNDEVERLMMRIRSAPPSAFGTQPVATLTDYLDDGEMPVPANVLRFDLADGSRVMIRPSGTEPKLKVYLDVCSAEGSLAERQRDADARLAALRDAATDLVAWASDPPIELTSS